MQEGARKAYTLRAMPAAPIPPPAPGPRLLDRVRVCVRARHYSIRTEEAYVGWIRRFILFHGKRHPSEMGEPEINAFLSHLATANKVSASTQTQALSALLFLYRVVLLKPFPSIADLIRAKKPKRLPTVLTREEVRAVLSQLDGVPKLVAAVLYGSGLRLLETLRLRVKDIDTERNQITVRDGKGQKDRLTMLSVSARAGLIEHLEGVRRLHREDLGRGVRSGFSPRRSGSEISRLPEGMGLAMGLSRGFSFR